MNCTFKRDEGKVTYNGITIDVSCNVRNELNGLRSLASKAVYSERADGKDGVPYMPRVFPLGHWRILSIDPKINDYEAPEFMSTSAHQPVDEWATNPDGTYAQKTGNQVEDFGYGFHNSSSDTTLGCGRILGELDGKTKYSTKERQAWFDAVRAAWARGETVWIDVI